MIEDYLADTFKHTNLMPRLTIYSIYFDLELHWSPAAPPGFWRMEWIWGSNPLQSNKITASGQDLEGDEWRTPHLG
jgi:hypothetical protein